MCSVYGNHCTNRIIYTGQIGLSSFVAAIIVFPTNIDKNVNVDVIMESKAAAAESQRKTEDEKCIQTRRLLSVCGHEERSNDIIYSPPQQVETNTAVVYFGGDIQDYSENMQKQRDGKKYMNWDLESTAQLLHRKFPTSHIVVVKPSRMEYLTFSCFKNFVRCNDFGIPEHYPNHYAIDHLDKLLINVTKRLRSSIVKQAEPESSNVDIAEGDMKDLVLIGFSKGCVVLNQFVHEIHHRRDSKVFGDRIRALYWLDGGHSGGRNTWVTSKPILQTLAQLPAALYVHVTPYQVEDERRPWIRKEERLFSDTLTRFGATLHRHLHFASADNSVQTTNIDINTHFNVLTEFKPDVTN